jgi:hypothetical protein
VDLHLFPLEITRANEPSDSKSVKNVIMGGEETTQKNPNDLYLRLQADYVHAEAGATFTYARARAGV